MKPGRQALEALLAVPDEEAKRILAELDAELLERFAEDWPAWVHAGQSVPDGGDWRVCVMLGGRGFGKTRAGAEWISALAREHPAARFALVAATLDEARQLMIEGPSGLIAVARADEVERMRWQPSRRRLIFASGAEAYLYSGASADALRGPEHDFAWCDELAKWKQAGRAWANLMLGLRRGEAPRALVTTTPRAGPLLKALIVDAGDGAAGRAERGQCAARAAFPRRHAAAARRHQGRARGAGRRADRRGRRGAVDPGADREMPARARSGRRGTDCGAS